MAETIYTIPINEAFDACAESEAPPVSYTHLDVYKRQKALLPCGNERFVVIAADTVCLLYTSRCV